MLKTKLKSLPKTPGVYLFKNSKGKIIYVGKAVNLNNRVKSYFNKSLSTGEKTKLLVDNIKSLEIIKVDSEIEALLLEANLIQKYQPKYNIDLKDNSSYPSIKITTNEKFPRVTQTRKIIHDGAKYYGPYTDITTLRFILKTLRKIFKFRSCKTLPKKPCLYYYINKCQAPCIFNSTEQAKEYKKNIKNIILFLDGKKDLLIKNLTVEMKISSKDENYEKANQLKTQIEKIKDFTKPSNKPYEYLKNPDLLDDQINLSLDNLKKSLNLQNLSRIECYDVANIQGQFSTASMIVFTNGQKDTDSYRRFKIHTTGKPNDYKMLEETLLRRFKHNEWPSPDLVIIDGGLGQLNVFNNLKINIPAIALAKREEKIYFKNKIIILDRSSPALKLLQRIRDEAHRFATTYHKKLRLQSLTNPL